jgi:hypothetical protein
MASSEVPRKHAHYSVAKDFVSWLTETTRLCIRDESSLSERVFPSGMFDQHNDNTTWTFDLIRHSVAKLKHVEHFDIDRKVCDVDLGLVFELLDFPKLKSLDIAQAQFWPGTEVKTKVSYTPITLFNITHIPSYLSWFCC